jgi:putative endonuclease
MASNTTARFAFRRFRSGRTRAPDPPIRPPSARELGRLGEDLAARYLRVAGYRVLSRNWHCRDGELDLVALDRLTIVVCEVKARSTVAFGAPVEAVTAEKARRIRRATHAWLSRHNVGCRPVRFDVLSVVWPPGGQPRLTHHKNAF